MGLLVLKSTRLFRPTIHIQEIFTWDQDKSVTHTCSHIVFAPTSPSRNCIKHTPHLSTRIPSKASLTFVRPSEVVLLLDTSTLEVCIEV